MARTDIACRVLTARCIDKNSEGKDVVEDGKGDEVKLADPEFCDVLARECSPHLAKYVVSEHLVNFKFNYNHLSGADR